MCTIYFSCLYLILLSIPVSIVPGKNSVRTGKKNMTPGVMAWLNGSIAANYAQYNGYERYYQQDMNKPSGLKTNKANGPANNQDNGKNVE